MVAACKIAKRWLERRRDTRRIARLFGIGDVSAYQLEKCADGAAAVLGQLAADEVHRLDPVGAFVDLGDASVADELLDAMLADIAVAAIDLLRVDRGGKALVGEIAFDDWREQAEQVLGASAAPPRRANGGRDRPGARPTAPAPAQLRSTPWLPSASGGRPDGR